MIKKIKEKQKYKRIPVEKCGFSLRTYYALRRSGIDDLYSLVCIYNSDEISNIKSIGRGCSKEIEGYFIENFPEMRTEGSVPVSNISNPKFVEFLEKADKKSIELLDLSNYIITQMKNANIFTIKVLLLADLDKMYEQGKLGKFCVNKLKGICAEILEKKDKYLECDEYGLLVNRKRYTQKDFDKITIEKLRADYGLSMAMLAEWFGITRQAVSQRLRNCGPIRDKWVGKKYSSTDKAAVEKMIAEKSNYTELKGNKYYLLTGKDDYAVICINDKEIKCFIQNYTKDIS